MNVQGWCDSCHRVRTVNVSGSGMTKLAMGGIATGTCSQCRQDEDDLRRSRPMGNLVEHLEIEHEMELAPPADAHTIRGLRRMHDDMHRRRHWDHRHVGRDDRIILTRR